MLNPLLASLGYDREDRLVLFHADDVGMCHGSNQAFLELTAVNVVRSGSLMLPCPWAPEMLFYCRENPLLDLGVHLTLTSEWASYRWGPFSTRDPASGLLDGEGYFWRRVEALQQHLHVAAAVAEMREQIRRVRAAGIDFTHLDTHMGAAIIPELLEAYVTLGFDYQVPVLLPRQMDDYIRSLGLAGPNEQAWLDFTADVEARGMPLVDWFRITPGYHVDERDGGRAALYEEILAKLPPGVTYFSLHPNTSGDIETIVPDRAHWRTFENDYFRSQRLADFLRRERIIPIGYREICQRMRYP